MRRSFDVDIDVKSGTNKDAFGVRSFVYNAEKMKMIPHPSGYFLQSENLIKHDIPVDADTGLSALDADRGETEGFFKVDLLTNTTYDGFKNKAEVLECLDPTKVDWNQLLDKSVVESLPHINKNYSIVRQLQPKSVDDLSDVLAIIRPGKIDLLDDYIENKERTRKRLYKRPQNGGMYFKRSHAIAYAMMIVMLLNKQKKTSFFD